MSNPGDEDLNVFETYGLEDEIRSAVLPQLVGFEGEQWGSRNPGAVLDAWVRKAIIKGALSESILRESVQDMRTLWQDLSPERRGKVPAGVPVVVVVHPTRASTASSSDAAASPFASIDNLLTGLPI